MVINGSAMLAIAAAICLAAPAWADCDTECLWRYLQSQGLDVCSKPIAQLNVEELARCQAAGNSLAAYQLLRDPEYRRQMDDKLKADKEARERIAEAARVAERERVAEAAAQARAAAEEEKRRAPIRYHDPGATPLCAPPHRMTARDGCQ